MVATLLYNVLKSWESSNTLSYTEVKLQTKQEVQRTRSNALKLN